MASEPITGKAQRRSQKAGITTGCVALILLLGWLDYVTGETPDFFVFSFIPIALGSWFAGLGTGLSLAILSAFTWLAADVMALGQFTWLTESWNMILRLIAFLLVSLGVARIRKDYLQQRALNAELTEALAEIRQLQGILPMCSFCRRIRDKEGQWVPVEIYIHDHSDARISHGLCPRCYRKHYGAPDGT